MRFKIISNKHVKRKKENRIIAEYIQKPHIISPYSTQQEVKTTSTALSFSEIAKFNPYHGPDGRFSTSGSAASFTYKPGASTAHSKAIEREKAKAAEETEKGFKGTLYHGSPNTDIKEFDMKRAGQNTSSGEKLLFFTDSKQMAEDFSYERLDGSSKFFQQRGKKGRVYEVDVEMKKPLDFRNLSDKDIDNILKLDTDGLLTRSEVKRLAGKNHQLLKTNLELTADRLKELGYDGMIANTGKAGHNSYEYAVVDSKQAKIKKSFTFEKSDQKYTLFIGLKVDDAEKLAVDGGESPEDFHITLAYGYFIPRSDEEDTTCRIQNALESVRDLIPDKIRFDAIDRFTASDSSDGKDVIIARVAAGQLEQVNRKLLAALKEQGIKLEVTFPDYKPHMTLSYIDPGEDYKLSKINTTGTVTKILIGHGQNTEESRKNTFSIQKADEDKRLVFGWANIAIRSNGEQIEDLQGDMTDPEDLEEGVYQYVLNFRDAGEEHIPGLRKKARMVESVVFTEEKLQAMGIPSGTVPLGWWIGFYVDDDETWRKIKDGTYSMFSIEGKGTRIPIKKSSGVAKSFHDMLKFNPYHGKDGRFTGPNGYASFSANPDTKSGMAAIKREQKKNPLIGAAYGTKKSPGQIEQEKKDKKSQAKAKELVKDYGVTQNQKAIVTDIKDFYRKIDENNNIRLKDDGTIGISRKAYNRAMDIARKAADNATITDNSTKSEYDAIRSYVKRTPVKISNQDKSNIVDFGSYRRSAFGNLTISNNGISVDSFYQQLSSQYPHLFDSKKITNPGDQLMSINDAINSLKPRQQKLSGEMREQFISSMFSDIVNGYFNRDLPIAKSFSELMKFNPYHDRLGRFSTRGGYVSFAPGTGQQAARAIALENEKRKQDGDEPNIGGAHANMGRMTFAEARAKLKNPGGSVKDPAKDPKEPEKKPKEDRKKPEDPMYPEMIAGVKRGDPMSFEEANHGTTNPNFNKGGGYHINCQTCVVANEARRRGYDVTARPKDTQEASDLSRNTRLAWIDPKTGKTPDYMEGCKDVSTAKQAKKYLDDNLEVGGRYNMGFAWKGRSRSGHIINAYKDKDGSVKLYDPQSGKIMSGKEVDQYLTRIKYKTTFYGTKFNLGFQVLRVDDKQFNVQMVDKILEKGA